MMNKSLFVLVLSLLTAITIHGQGIDVSPTGVMISHGHPKGGWMISYSYMNMHMKDNLSGTEIVTDDDIFLKDYRMSPQEMNMNMHMLMGMYGLTGRLSLMVMFSYNDYSMDMKSFSPGHVHGSSTAEPSLFHTHETSGFGDIKLWALYKLLNGENSSFVLSAGLNFPAGNYQIPAGEHATFEGEHMSYMMQMSTGSVDIMPGVTYYKKSGKIAWSLQALGTIRPFYNSAGYHYGSDITVNAWTAFQFIPSLSGSLRIEGISGQKIYGSDPMISPLSEPGSDPENYGGMKSSAFAGVNYYFNKGFLSNSKIGVEYGMPFYENVNGIQMSTQYMLNAGFTKSF